MAESKLKHDIRQDFPLLHDRSIVYLDSAATSQKPKAVLDAQRRFYETSNANVHRGVHRLSVAATESFEAARAAIAAFINAEPEEIVFVRNATEGINLFARSWGAANVRPNELIALTTMEHHSNIVPWQQLAQARGCDIAYVPFIKESGELDLEQLGLVLEKKPKLLSLTHVSNVFGTVTPMAEVVAKAHVAGTLVLVDACQSAPHIALDVKKLGCDALVFSGHKTLGPMGVGVLYVRKKLLEIMPPFLSGGEMIKTVTLDRATYNDVPHRFEAGTPDVAGAIGVATGLRYLQNIGMEVVEAHVRELTDYAVRKLATLPYVKLLNKSANRLGLVSFTVDGVPAHDVASLLDEKGVCVRSGHHCAMPLHAELGIEQSVRASFSIYNVREDVDALIEALEHCRKVFFR